MKKKDIVLILIVVFISAVLSFILSNAVISSPNSRTQKVEVVEKITSDFPRPSEKYFNDKSIDPTLLIRIGDNTNTSPFNSKVKP